MQSHNEDLWPHKSSENDEFWPQKTSLWLWLISGPRNCQYRTISGPRNRQYDREILYQRSRAAECQIQAKVKIQKLSFNQAKI